MNEGGEEGRNVYLPKPDINKLQILAAALTARTTVHNEDAQAEADGNAVQKSNYFRICTVHNRTLSQKEKKQQS